MTGKLALLFGVVVVTHYGYPLLSDTPDAASWLFYILRGVEGMALCYLLLDLAPRMGKLARLWCVICWVGMFEESQTAICGVMADPHLPIPLTSGLCLEQFGPLPYALAAIAALAYLIIGGRRDSKG